jgi:hypothetical protein
MYLLVVNLLAVQLVAGVDVVLVVEIVATGVAENRRQIFVGRGSTKEFTHHPPPNSEMNANI